MNDNDRIIKEQLMPGLEKLGKFLRKQGFKTYFSLTRDIVPCLMVSQGFGKELALTILPGEDGGKIIRILDGEDPEASVSWTIFIDGSDGYKKELIMSLMVFFEGLILSPYPPAEVVDSALSSDDGSISTATAYLMPRINTLVQILQSFDHDELTMIKSEAPVIYFSVENYVVSLCYEQLVDGGDNDSYLLHLRSDIPTDLSEKELKAIAKDFQKNHDFCRLTCGESVASIMGEGNFLTLYTAVPEFGGIKENDFYGDLLSDFFDVTDEVLERVFGE